MKFENETFTADVTLDCNEFVDCTFRDCMLVFQGGPYHLANAKFERVRFGVSGYAVGALNFLRMVRAAAGQKAIDEILDSGAKPPPGSFTVN